MKSVYVHTLFDKDRKPLIIGLYNPSTSKTRIFPLHIPGTGKSIFEIDDDKAKIVLLLERLLVRGYRLVLSDFKDYLYAFGFPIAKEKLEVYDLFLPQIKPPNSLSKASRLLKKFLPKMAKMKPQPWQQYSANAAVVYQSLENRGIMAGTVPQYPVWSQRTYSGRSKTMVYNLQGTVEADQITNPAGTPDDAFIHFDWRGADIRIASLLCGDSRLLALSEKYDPYQTIADRLNQGGAANGVTRNECKIALLKAINSMNTDLLILDLFPKLRKWIAASRTKLNAGEPLYSILGRKFVLVKGKKPLSIFNATMQGSIAHAIQISIRRVWEEVGDRLLAEVHDSMVVTCDRTKASMQSTIDQVADIMCHPFSGVLDSNPMFPVRVSVGTAWRNWKEHEIYSGQ